jgi:hypothetical protein
VFSENIRNDRVLESLLRGTNYLVDFTFQERLTASALNLAFGAGSFFIERDGVGGGVTAALEGLGTVSLITAFALYNAFFGDDSRHSITQTYYAYPFYAGVGFYVGGAIYGILRAQTRHKPGSQMAVNPFDRLGIDLVSTANDGLGLKISYAWSF